MARRRSKMKIKHNITTSFQITSILIASLVLPTQVIFAQQEMKNRGPQRKATVAVVNPALTSPLRETISLDGQWDFATDPNNQGEQQKWFRPDKPLPDIVSIKVPGCWEAQGIGGPGISYTITPEKNISSLIGSYMGTAWYKKTVTIPKGWAGKQIWLKVGGVHCQGWFWVNGTYVAHMANYCGTYKYNITDLVKLGQRTVISAKVRNDVTSRKGLFAWVHRFGGLYRSVELEATPQIWIDNAYVEPLFDEKKARVNIKLRNSTSIEQSNYQIEVIVSTLEGIEAGRIEETVSLCANKTADMQLDVVLNPFRPWSPKNPNLYKAHIILRKDGREIDGWMERFGIRKWEVRGEYFYLNNQKFFVRGFGDDYIYPLTLCSPVSRDIHKKHLQIAKDFGFVYVRHHTHCEIPEFFEAADEIGIMVQPELPYYGYLPSANTAGYFRPKEDLLELINHYRRYVSLATYCTGNEGHMRLYGEKIPIDRELYQLGKKLDPTRLFLHQDGGRNTPENSDFETGPMKPWKPGTLGPKNRSSRHRVGTSRPFFAHEYLNLSLDEDPRLADKYTGALRAPVDAETFKKELDQAGLSWEWGIACIEAGNKLQSIYQKRGLESARREVKCDGYIYWTIVDVGSYAAQGLFNPFWEPKAGTAEQFLQFNGPTAILIDTFPGSRIVTEGNDLKIDWMISHFGSSHIENKTLRWKLIGDGETFASGNIPLVNAEVGDVKVIGSTIIKIPSLEKAVKAKLIANLEKTNIENYRDIWLFPRPTPSSGAGEGICASEKIYSALVDRYPGLAKFGSAEADDAEIILTDAYLTSEVLSGLEKGKSVILLELTGPKPRVTLGWWMKSNQTGTAIAKHPAFGTFPHSGYLDEVFFRMVKNAIKMKSGGFNSVEPLMVGHGNEGYLLYVFQAKAGNGKILGSGFNLLSGNSESVYLLNEFIKYVKSERFKPKGTLGIAKQKPK